MATLFNTKISQTYQGLLKTIDNAVLSATLRELTDGSGNQSGLFLNTAGDFKVTAILEWGSLKDTGTGVTITQFVTQANGIANFDNDTTIPTSAAVKDYVDTKFSQTDTLTEVLGFGNTTSGKDIAVSANDDITFTDSSKAIFGAGSDLQIYHESSNISYIKHNASSDFRIQTSSTGYIKLMAELENMAVFIPNNAVELYFDNSKKLATTNTGVDVTGNLVVSGTITGSGGSFLPLAGGTMTGNIVLNDNVKSIYGTGSDLQLFHNSSNNISFITNSNAAGLRLQSDEILILANDGTTARADFSTSVKLFYADSSKLETASTGVAITGTLSTTSNVTVGANATFVDNGKAIFGAGSDLQIYHDGSNSYIDDAGTGDLRIKSSLFRVQSSSGEAMINASENGIVQLYENNTERFRTVTDGAKVTGNLEVTGTITGSGGSFLPLAGGTMTGNTIHNDNVKSIYGTGSDFSIYHDGSNSYIKDTSGTGDLIIDTNTFRLRSANGGESMIRAFEDSAVILSFNNIDKLATTNTGVAVTGNGAFSGNVSVPDSAFLYAGSSDDLSLTHNGTDSIIRNYTGDFQINQGAVTKSIVFKVSNANALDTTALTINREGDLTTGADVTIAGNLTVNGTTTTINTQTLAVEDPLIELSKDNGANSVDIGFYGKYNDGTARYLGLFSDASDSNKFRLFKGTTVQPTTTVNIAGAGYVAADLVVAGLEATTGTVSATSFISTTDAGINVNGLTLTRIAANTAFRTSGGLETLGLLRSYAGLNVAQTATFGGDVSVEDNIYITDATTTRAKIQLNAGDRDNLDIKAVSLGSTMSFYTVDTLALTLDASQNAQFANAVLLADNKKLEFGGSGDLKIYHSAGSDSYIQATTGDLIIQNTTDDKDIIFQSDNGSGGLTTYFYLDGSAQASGSPFTVFPDNSNLSFGTGYDLRQYHNGTDSYLDNHKGNLNIRNFANDKDINFLSDNGSGGDATYFRIDGSEVEIAFLKTAHYYDNIQARFGDSGDLRIYHDSSNSYIQDTGTGRLIIKTDYFEVDNAAGTEAMIEAIQDGAVNLYYNGSKKFETTSTGVSVTGEVRVYSGSSLGYFGVDTGNSYVYLGSNTSGYSLALQTSGTNALTIDSSQNSTFAGTINSGRLFVEQSGADIIDMTRTGVGTYRFAISGSDAFSLFDVGANADRLVIDSSGNSTFAGNVSLTSGSLSITGDGSNAATLTETSVGIFTIAAADDIILDATGDIALDAGGDDIRLRVNGTTYGSFNNASSNLNIFSTIQDKSIKFLGNDNGTQITALTLNMADGGDATFAGKVTANGVYSAGQSAIIYKAQRNGGAVASDWSYDDATTDMSLGTSTSHSFSLKTGNTRAFTIDTSQKSTFTTDTGVLIKGASGSVSAKLSFLPASGGRQYDLGNVGADFRIFDASANVTRMYFDNDGNTGIGTTTPSQKLDVSGVVKQKGTNNYEDIIVKSGDTGTYTFTYQELSGNMADNISYFIFVSVYRPTTDVANDVGTLILHGVMPRGAASIFSTMSTVKGTGISVLTATNSNNSLVITTDSGTTFRCAVKVIAMGGTT